MLFIIAIKCRGARISTLVKELVGDDDERSKNCRRRFTYLRPSYDNNWMFFGLFINININKSPSLTTAENQ